VTLVTRAERIVGQTYLMKRAGPKNYEQLAKRCVELASESSAPTVAEALRALAVDYLRRAAKLRRREPINSRQGRPNRLVVSKL
jgi:enoyl reductase-like protein